MLKLCRRDASDYAADFSVPILDHGRNAKKKGRSAPRPCTVDMIDIDRKLIP